MNGTHSLPLVVKPSWRWVLPKLLVFLAVAAVGCWVTMSVPESVLEVPIPLGDDSLAGGEVTLRLPIFLLIALFFLVRPIVLLFDSRYEISAHHLRTWRGRLSVRRRRQEFAYEDLLGVQVAQTLLDRLLGVGTITVGSKTQSIEVVMKGIAHPQRIADLISRGIDGSRVVERARGGIFS